jgi:3-hydroxypropanoate dehydrogenase
MYVRDADVPPGLSISDLFCLRIPPDRCMSQQPLEPAALQQLFFAARSFNRFNGRPVSDGTLRELYDILRWGPTSQNTQPARYVFVRTPEGKGKLLPALKASNIEKTALAPVTVIVAIDSQFYEHLPTQFLPYDAKPTYQNDPALARKVAFRNGTLQGGYLLMAARALGLDCGAMSGFDHKALDAAFFPDGRWHSNFLVNLGYGDPAGNHPPAPRLTFEQVAQWA